MAAGSPAATSRASFLACLRRESIDGRTGRDREAVMAASFHERLCPAETRLKEGAIAHDLDRNRWECSLAAGRWRPVSALPAVSEEYGFAVKRGADTSAPARGAARAGHSPLIARNAA